MTTAGSLGGSAARGATLTMAGQLLRVGVQFASIVILARLLSPSDYGLLAMVLAVVGIGEIFRDFGLSSAAIQAKDLSREERDNLFWTNTGIGATLSVLAVGASFVLPLIYGEPRLQAITAALAVTFLLNGASTQQRADLTRSMRFGALAMVEVVAQVAGFVAGVSFALAGAGYWALVAQQLTIPLLALILLVSSTRWIPGPPHRHVSIRRFFKFGMNLLGVQLLTYVSRNVDSVVIGARFGSAQLGAYDRAFQLLMLPLNQINAPATRVALPVLSKLQDDPERFARFILRGQLVLVHVITAIFAFAIAQAPALIAIVLGSQWGETVYLFQILAVGGVAQALTYAAYWAFLASGRVDSNLRYSLLTRPILVVGILVGSLWGPAGIATAYAGILMLFWPLALWWVSRVSATPGRAMFAQGLRTMVGYAICGLAAWAATLALGDLLPIVDALIGAAAFLAAGAIVVLVWPGFRRDIVTVVQTARLVRKR